MLAMVGMAAEYGLYVSVSWGMIIITMVGKINSTMVGKINFTMVKIDMVRLFGLWFRTCFVIGQ